MAALDASAIVDDHVGMRRRPLNDFALPASALLQSQGSCHQGRFTQLQLPPVFFPQHNPPEGQAALHIGQLTYIDLRFIILTPSVCDQAKAIR
jgi:hypothetical protein